MDEMATLEQRVRELEAVQIMDLRAMHRMLDSMEGMFKIMEEQAKAIGMLKEVVDRLTGHRSGE